MDSYTYAHLTPLCFSDVSRTDDPEWAKQATQTTPQIIFKQLNLNVLKAPTLAEDTDGGKVNPDNNQLTYTFNWTQEDMGTKKPTYSIKLYGLLTDENGNVTVVHATYDPATKSGSGFCERKVKGTIHWVAAETAKQVEVRLYENIVDEEKGKLNEDGSLNLNPNSLTILKNCYVEPAQRFLLRGLQGQQAGRAGI